MRYWLKITAQRLVIVGVSAALLAYILVLWPAVHAKQVIKQQTKASGQAVAVVQSAQTLISGVPDISQVKTQQLGSFASYAGSIKQASEKLNKLSISYNRPHELINVFKKPQLAADTNSAISDIDISDIQKTKNDINNVQDYMSYQTNVSKALVSILEYNPAVDIANFSLGSDDTNQRLLLAKKGLAKTLDQLDSAKGKYKDPGLSQIISIIKSLQDSRDQLAKSGDTSAWADAIDQAQSNIITNRKEFLNSNTQTFQVKLNTDSISFSKIQKAWASLASKYKL